MALRGTACNESARKHECVRVYMHVSLFHIRLRDATPALTFRIANPRPEYGPIKGHGLYRCSHVQREHAPMIIEAKIYVCIRRASTDFNQPVVATPNSRPNPFKWTIIINRMKLHCCDICIEVDTIDDVCRSHIKRNLILPKRMSAVIIAIRWV